MIHPAGLLDARGPKGSHRQRENMFRASQERVLLGNLLFIAPSTARLWRSGNDVGNPRVIHFLIQRGQILLRNLLDLHRRFIHQRRQFRQLFFLLSARRSCKSIQVPQQLLHLIRQRIGLPLQRRPGVTQSFALADKLRRRSVHFLLQLICGLDDVVGNLRHVGFPCILLPLLPRRLQRCLDCFDGPPVLRGGLGHRIELIHRLVPCRPVSGRNRNSGVLFHGDFLRGFLVAGLDLDGVFPRLGQRSARPEAKPRCDRFLLFRCRLRGRVPSQIPVRAVHTRRARPVEFAHHLPVLIEHCDLYFAFLLLCGGIFRLGRVFLFFVIFVLLRGLRRHSFLQVIIQNCPVRRILCREHFLPRAPAAVAHVPGGRRSRREKGQG